MVKVRGDLARAADGRVDIAGWVDGLVAAHGKLERQAVADACEFVRGLGSRGEPYLESGIELAEIVGALHLDTASIVSALL